MVKRGALVVGREVERAAWARMLTARKPRPRALYVHGAGGIGKTSLLDELARTARRRMPVAHVELREGEAVPRLVTETIADALGVDAADVVEGRSQGRFAVVIDGCDRVGSGLGWITRVLLPRLPSACPVALAGRAPPDERWRDEEIAPLVLAPLTRDESQLLLAARGVVEAERDALIRLAHGNPLALSIAAELARQGRAPLALESSPELIQALLGRMLSGPLKPAERAALEALSVARVLDEALLERWVGPEDAHRTFRWLTRLPFVRLHRAGLTPHDLARDVLAGDLRWRNPERFASLRAHALSLYLGRVRHSELAQRQKAIADATWLYQDLPIMHTYARWREFDAYVAEPAARADAGEIEGMIREHEGTRAAAIARRWLELDPEGSWVIRDADGDSAGYFSLVRLDRVSKQECAFDPIAAAAHAHVAAAGALELGRPVLLNRHWLSRDDYQDVSAVSSFCTSLMTQAHVTWPDVSLSLGVFRDATKFRLMFAVLGFGVVAEAELDGARYAVVARDWRGVAPLEFITRYVEQVSGIAGSVQEEERLTRPRFEAAVREALKSAALPHSLSASPLAISPIVAGASPSERAAALRALLVQANDALRASPKTARQARAVAATYLEPLGTQETVARELGLPFSTYRRHLVAGIEQIAAILYRRYADGASPTGASPTE